MAVELTKRFLVEPAFRFELKWVFEILFVRVITVSAVPDSGLLMVSRNILAWFTRIITYARRDMLAAKYGTRGRYVALEWPRHTVSVSERLFDDTALNWGISNGY